MKYTVPIKQDPAWSFRNKFISSLIPPNCSVLDLGCGTKDLLKYIAPSKYLGVDYYSEYADLKINFNEKFEIPPGHWNYIVCSGLLEYLDNLDIFFSTIKDSADNYIVTYWKSYKEIKNPNKVNSINSFAETIEQHFQITNHQYHFKHHIYLLIDK